MAKYFKNRGRSWENEHVEPGRKKQPMSGASWTAKNDLRDDRFLWEAKSTGAGKIYGLKKIDLKNVARNADISGRVPLLSLDFSGDEFIIMRRKDFDFLIDKEIVEA